MRCQAYNRINNNVTVFFFLSAIVDNRIQGWSTEGSIRDNWMNIPTFSFISPYDIPIIITTNGCSRVTLRNYLFFRCQWSLWCWIIENCQLPITHELYVLCTHIWFEKCSINFIFYNNLRDINSRFFTQH